MHSIWTRYEHWLDEHWPGGRAALNPPATDEQIARLEAALGVALPEDYVACLKIHNGQGTQAGGLFDGQEFLSTDEVLAQWTVWKGLLDDGTFADAGSRPASGVRPDWWHPRWIPFTHNGCGDHLCLDLAPDAGGTEGQVITMWHDFDDRDLLAPRFQDWFASYAKRVFSGELVFSEEDGTLVDRRDAA